MNTRHRIFKCSAVAVMFVTFIAIGVLCAAQGRPEQAPSGSDIVPSGQEWQSHEQDFFSLENAPEKIRNAPGIPVDWSTRHTIFANESSPEVQAKFRYEPRFWIQHLSRLRRQAVTDTETGDFITAPRFRRNLLGGAWSYSLDGFWNIDHVHALPYPAKYIFTNTQSASCSDWVVYTGTANGSNSTFSIIAFTNLYTGCSGPVVKFAYDGGTQGHPLSTSSVISLDNGTQVAFIEAATATLDILYLPATDTGVSGSTWPAPKPASVLPACSGGYPPTNRPCLYTFTLQHVATTSAPYVDYANDNCWVSDDNGDLYKIHPFFEAQPTTGTLTPVVTPTNKGMSAPTLDPNTQTVFYSDAGGDLCAVNASTFTHLGTVVRNSAASNIEAPVVDSTTQQVFVFSAGTPNGTAGSSLVQVPENFSGVSSNPTTSCTTISPNHFVLASLGTGTGWIRIGTANFAYFNGEDTSGNIPSTGLMYACGQDAANNAVLYAFSFSSAGVMNTTPANGPRELESPTGPAAGCSPLTENYDGTTDRLFLGLQANCPAPSGGSAIAAGCVESFHITTGFPSSNTPDGMRAYGTASGPWEDWHPVPSSRARSG